MQVRQFVCHAVNRRKSWCHRRLMSRRLSVASTSSLTSLSARRDADEDDSWHRWKAIIPGVIFRHCQPRSDWNSARDRRVHRFLLIVLPSLPMLVAVLVSAICLQHRYHILVYTENYFFIFVQKMSVELSQCARIIGFKIETLCPHRYVLIIIIITMIMDNLSNAASVH